MRVCVYACGCVRWMAQGLERLEAGAQEHKHHQRTRATRAGAQIKIKYTNAARSNRQQ